ncbi:MAG TPA: monofunctional biosynthetic peptidoglycan transglycosylase [Acidobacteriaceae bacterium]|nr:monofunctional biosynthetic peptidoglycan transglycosylase [Acidobacteriaceae bacterium]
MTEELEPEAEPEAGSPESKRRLRQIAQWAGIAVASLWLLGALVLVCFKWIDPPTTAVHVERHLQAWMHGKPYHERYRFVPLSQISPNLQHAVIAAEDARFYQHHGFDWHAMELAADHDMKGGRIRGGSTLDQQLMKNLFLGTERSIVRKGVEASFVPVAELVLGKQRILELYLNEVEWGPGVYGAEAACHYYYGTSARNLSRDQAARLAAILPDPRRRRPQYMNRYSGIIETRMSQMGW